MMLSVTLPIRIDSLTNERGHWAKRSKPAAQHRWLASRCFTYAKSGIGLLLPCVVRLTRIAPREFDDDNIRAAFKSVRDGIADWLGLDDRDKRVSWLYEQESGKPRQYAVRIDLIPRSRTVVSIVEAEA